MAMLVRTLDQTVLPAILHNRIFRAICGPAKKERQISSSIESTQAFAIGVDDTPAGLTCHEMHVLT